jgi:hypothetical protein
MSADNNMKRSKRSILARIGLAAVASILIVSAVFAMSNAKDAISADINDPVLAPIPDLDYDDPAKSVAVRLTFNGPTEATFESAKVSLERAHTHAGDPPMLLVRTFDYLDSNIEEFNSWHPLLAHEYGDDGSEKMIVLPSASGRFIIPFNPDMASMKVIALPTTQEVITINLKPAIHDFCVDNPADPDCKAADLAILSVAAVQVPPLFVIGEPGVVSVRTVMTNNGPDTPIDTELSTIVVAADSGVSVTPAAVTQDELALELNEQRQLDHSYSIECLEPGNHAITFTSRVAPLPANVVDIDDSNNEGVTELTVDCAIPVAVNIKPGSYPNSFSLKNKDAVPVAVLTTVAGEYAKPLAFDATTINALSARFGACDIVADGSGGGSEIHNIGHIENAFELNDKTKDKDLDMVLHFQLTATGLKLSDTQGCVKGTFTSGADTFTFFGSDSVRIVK